MRKNKNAEATPEPPPEDAEFVPNDVAEATDTEPRTPPEPFDGHNERQAVALFFGGNKNDPLGHATIKRFFALGGDLSTIIARLTDSSPWSYFEPTTIPRQGTFTAIVRNAGADASGAFSLLSEASGQSKQYWRFTANGKGEFVGRLTLRAKVVPGVYEMVTNLGDTELPSVKITVTGG